MFIQKGKIKYVINECKEHWSVKADDVGLSVSYNVNKDLCKTENEIKNYIINNEMFRG